MTKLSRVCPHCGEQGSLESTYCAHCGQLTGAGQDASTSLPPNNASGAEPGTSLSIRLGRAALPLLAGAAGLAVRAGWKLLQSQAARDVALNAANSAIQSRLQGQPQQGPSAIQPTANQTVSKPSQPLGPRKGGRTIRISSRWAIGDANGIVRQGQSEHTIEIDD